MWPSYYPTAAIFNNREQHLYPRSIYVRFLRLSPLNVHFVLVAAVGDEASLREGIFAGIVSSFFFLRGN
jgi:hypothetical protein